MAERRRNANPQPPGLQEAFFWLGEMVTIQRADQLGPGVWSIHAWSKSRDEPIVLLLGSPGCGARVKDVQKAAKTYLSKAATIEQRGSLPERLRRRRRDNDLPDGRTERIDLNDPRNYRVSPATNRAVAEWMNESFWMSLKHDHRHGAAEAREILRSLRFSEERAATCVEGALSMIRSGGQQPRDFPLTKDDVAQALRIRGAKRQAIKS